MTFFNDKKSKEQNKKKTTNIVDIRNDIIHSCDKNGKESCFIAKQMGMPKGILWYGQYDINGNFSDSTIDLSELCISQMQKICQQLKVFSSIPKEQIFFESQMKTKNY